jgi:hypothetical protein
VGAWLVRTGDCARSFPRNVVYAGTRSQEAGDEPFDRQGPTLCPIDSFSCTLLRYASLPPLTSTKTPRGRGTSKAEHLPNEASIDCLAMPTASQYTDTSTVHYSSTNLTRRLEGKIKSAGAMTFFCTTCSPTKLCDQQSADTNTTVPAVKLNWQQAPVGYRLWSKCCRTYLPQSRCKAQSKADRSRMQHPLPHQLLVHHLTCRLNRAQYQARHLHLLLLS